MTHAISVIMPNHDGSNFIAQAIKSVLEQSWADFELVIVDDGSADSSVRIVETFRDQDERVCLISHEANRGASAARNTGLEKSSSDLVTFMDSDDLMARERLERLVDAYEKNEGPRVVYSDVIQIDAGTETVEPKQTRRFRPSGMILSTLTSASFRFVAGPITAPKSLFAEVGPYDERLSWGEDFELCLRLAKKYPFEFDPISTYGHRAHAGSKTSVISKHDRWAQQATILERHMDDFLPRLDSAERRGLYNNLFSCYVASNQLGKIPKVGLSDVQAFISMMGLPVRALVR